MNLLPISIFNVKNDLEDKIIASLGNDIISNMIINNNCYEPHFNFILNKILSENDIAVDIGANIGYHTLSMAKIVGNYGKVYAFEPQRILFQELCCNVILNRLDNVYAYNAGISSEISYSYLPIIDYYSKEISLGCISLNNNDNKNTEKVELFPLEYFNIKKINFVKIDVEGYELNVLNGMNNILINDNPTLFIEINSQDYHDTLNFLKNMNYNIYRVVVAGWDHDYLCIHENNPKNIDSINLSFIKL